MDDIRVNEDVPFVLDRMSGMEQNLKEYHTEPAKNEGEAIGAMQHYHKNVTPQYCPIIQLIAVIFLFTLRTSLDSNTDIWNIKHSFVIWIIIFRDIYVSCLRNTSLPTK